VEYQLHKPPSRALRIGRQRARFDPFGEPDSNFGATEPEASFSVTRL
jgi:hypothetical protein